MKQLATILLAIICQGAFAQLVQNPNIDLYIKQTLPQYQQAAGKTQAETMRLLGLRDENYVGGIYVDMDSANFIYDDNDGMQFLDLLNPSYSECYIVQFDGFIWVPYAHLENTFDDSDRRTSLEILYWDGAVYEPGARYTYSYDEDWHVVEILNEFATAGVYDNSTKTIYTYTLAGILDYYTTEVWTGADWETSTRSVYTYNPEGLVSILLQQDYIGGVFEDDYRIVYLYDGEDMITTSTVQQSDGIGGFDDYSRNIFTYDGSHFLIVNTLQYYDGVVWEDYSKTENDNNAEGLPDVYVISYWDGTIWEPDLRVTNTYETYDNTGIVDQIQDDIITLSPNPALNEITINFPTIRAKHVTIQIFDNEGRLISTEKASNLYYHSLDLTSLHLTPGIYHIELISDDLRYTKSFEKF